MNLVSTWLPLPGDKSHLDKKNGFLAVFGADLGSELTANSFSSPCINPQALMGTVRLNQ